MRLGLFVSGHRTSTKVEGRLGEAGQDRGGLSETASRTRHGIHILLGG